MHHHEMPSSTSLSREARALLALLLVGQFLVVLDISVVNVALPAMQNALDLSSTGLQWVVNGYTIAYAGFLLLGGRLADVIGQRRAFLGGVALFAAGSLVGGLAGSPGLLLAGRILQGLGAAVLSPATLTILLSSFPEGPRRATAMGWWMAIGAAGGATGGLVGGALTEWLSWRWVLLVNVPVGVAVLVAAAKLLADRTAERRPRLDVPGAATATLGLGALVLGITQIEGHGWTSAQALVPVAVAAVLLWGFAELQRRAPQPLMPPSLLRLPGLVVANVVMLVSGAGLFAIWFFLTLYMQEVLGWSALEAGAGFLPHTAAIILGTQVTTRWLAGHDTRAVVGASFLLSAAGFVLLWLADAGSGYLLGVAIPGVLVMFGAGIAFPPILGAATAGVEPALHGLASGVLNTARMVGGALGLAVLATVAAARTADVGNGADGLVAGFQLAYLVAAGTMVLSAALALLLPRPRPRSRPSDGDDDLPAGVAVLDVPDRVGDLA
jgi:EmrB/QacA subfamily drug resistance transporter